MPADHGPLGTRVTRHSCLFMTLEAMHPLQPPELVDSGSPDSPATELSEILLCCCFVICHLLFLQREQSLCLQASHHPENMWDDHSAGRHEASPDVGQGQVSAGRCGECAGQLDVMPS